MHHTHSFTRLTAAALLLLSLPAAAQDSPAKTGKETNGPSASTSQARADALGCLSCHEGIESIREEGSVMLTTIEAMGRGYGDPAGCVVCHGGTPSATTYAKAHQGTPANMSATGPKEYYPDPGSLFIADNTCGQCHPNYVYRLERGLMNTEAGKIQGNLHTWGIPEVQNYKVPWGNYDVADTDGTTPVIGTDDYKKYMEAMISAHPDQYPTELTQVPQPTVEEIEADPKLAGFTYQRQQCQRCHVSVRGREKRGDYRGMGCSACHILYGNEGIYEGSDPTIDTSEPGHLLSHRIHGTREAGNGIPVETCNSCHNRGKRIGVTYQGLMEFPYGSPYNADGDKQPKLHTKQYIFVSDDLHHQLESRPENPTGGMLCQDCHTTVDMHGDGNIAGTTLAQVEIECQDCHGTPDLYPWELPLGYSEEFAQDLPPEGRGLSPEQLPETAANATAYDAEEGFLLSARGNPLGNVVKDGDKVVLHSATGNDFFVPVLKSIAEAGTWKSPDAMVAMSSVAAHADNLECYACHASWVPQCYGCHVKMDYSEGQTDTDWVASGSKRDTNGQTAESPLGTPGIKSPGKAYESRSYLRWEDPVLGVNGEGRVTPLMPGCQVLYTVVDREGKVLVNNKIEHSQDEADAIGQDKAPLSIDMAPVQPHSAQRKARTCESCHDNPKAFGYGVNGGRFLTRLDEDVVEDLIDQRTGEVIPKNHKVQIPAVPAMEWDWSTIINPETGEQVQTVGTHWPGSRALNDTERKGLTRTGLCMGCHREMKNADLWGKVSTPGRLTDEEHIEKMNALLRASTQGSSMGGGAGGGCAVTGGLAAATLALSGLFVVAARRREDEEEVQG